MLSESEQDYLKAIYKLLRDPPEQKSVSTNRLADYMNVAAPSVTNMLKNLADMKLVVYEPYRGVRLTREGEKIALEMIRHHRLVELYLAEALGVPWDQVDQEAEKWEHILSEDIEDRIDKFLGNPTHDPHGAPIPAKNGEIEYHDTVPLNNLEAGQEGTVSEVSDHDPALLRYLSKLGMKPKTKIKVINKEPFQGPITVRIGKENRIIGQEVAQYVLIHEIDD